MLTLTNNHGLACSQAYGRSSFVPTDGIESLTPDTYYLEKVDDLHRRVYSKTPSV